MSTKRLRASTSLLTLFVAVINLSWAQGDLVIYQDDFSGSGGALHGTAPDVRPGTETWSANGPFRDNGTINGAIEGSALLPFDPVPNMKYTLSMDVLMPVGVDRWVALGFARDGLGATPMSDDVNARLSNEPEGITWMLFRDAAANADDVQVFRGMRTANQIADTATALAFGISHALSIVLDTTGNGSSFTADFLIDGASIVGGPQLISALSNPGGAGVSSPVLDVINFVGISYDDSTANAPSIDNFQLLAVAVPEASSFLAVGCATTLGLFGTLIARRRRGSTAEAQTA